MGITEQFAGLDMYKLIGAPLTASADASIMLANSTAEFINKVGFDSDGNTRNVAFTYEKKSVNEDGTTNNDQMKVEVPMLAIVPVPSLQIDEVAVLFDMEVKQSESSQTELDANLSAHATVGVSFLKVSVSGSVSAHSNNTRSSDNSAKYNVSVTATNHGTPEGLARVLDMMAANVAPSLISSEVRDADGKELSEEEKTKSEKLKTVRAEIDQLERRLRAAQDGLNENISQMQRIGSSQLNQYNAKVVIALNADNLSDEDNNKISTASELVSSSWQKFQTQVKDIIRMIADNNTSEDIDALKKEADENAKLSEMFALLAYDDKAIEAKKYESDQSYYKSLVISQNNAVVRQYDVETLSLELTRKKQEYNDIMSGLSTDSAAQKITVKNMPLPARKADANE